MEKYWTEHLNDLAAFQYSFEIPITKDDFKNKIVEVDEAFLKNGHKYKLFYVKQGTSNDLVLSYKESRKQQFFPDNNKWIKLLGFDQCRIDNIVNLLDEMFIDVPVMTENGIILTPIPYHQPFVNFRLLTANADRVKHWFDLEKEDFWFEKISFSLSSSSNIWWEEIDYTIHPNTNKTTGLRPPINTIAYHITPRLNSFVKSMAATVRELDGEVTLEEHKKSYVTKEGILLDRIIVYEEDIREGRSQLPK
jgi:hypothetical protein